MAYSLTVTPGIKINDPCWLTPGMVQWMLSVTYGWRLVGYRYQWEKKVGKARGFDFFLEVEYAPLFDGLDFPCVSYAQPDLPDWYIWWVDVVEYTHIKVISRLILKEDMCYGGV